MKSLMFVQMYDKNEIDSAMKNHNLSNGALSNNRCLL